jgi:pyruvate,water dikinase
LFYLPTLRETPALLVEMIDQVGQATNGAAEPANWQDTAESIAEKLPEAKRSEFRTQLARWRRCMLRTENDDHTLAKCTMLVRDAYLESGRRLAANQLIEKSEDVFFLTGSELRDSLAGHNERVSSSVVKERRQEFEQSNMLSPPPMIVNGRAMTPKSRSSGTGLVGTPASPGVANGIVLMLNDPFRCVGKQLPKDAVVVAPVVTPALAYSLIGCAALVTEIGGLASHGAIVAREMAIPAVVGVANVRSSLQTGMSVSVDGSTGKIEILSAQR